MLDKFFPGMGRRRGFQVAVLRTANVFRFAPDSQTCVRHRKNLG